MNYIKEEEWEPLMEKQWEPLMEKHGEFSATFVKLSEGDPRGLDIAAGPVPCAVVGKQLLAGPDVAHGHDEGLRWDEVWTFLKAHIPARWIDAVVDKARLDKRARSSIDVDLGAEPHQVALVG